MDPVIQSDIKPLFSRIKARLTAFRQTGFVTPALSSRESIAVKVSNSERLIHMCARGPGVLVALITSTGLLYSGGIATRYYAPSREDIYKAAANPTGHTTLLRR